MNAIALPIPPADAHLLVETGDFFLHRMHVGRFPGDRGAYSRQLAAGKKVLHVGCVDSPIFNPAANLHIHLDPVCELDGLDTDVAGLDELRKYVRGCLYSHFSEVVGVYDLVLVPEVAEHVSDHAAFFAALDSIAFEEVVVTVPCAFNAQRHQVFQYDEGQGLFQEFVHPDHRVWYTPFTLYTTIKTYTPWHIEEIFFLGELSVAARCRRRARDPELNAVGL